MENLQQQNQQNSQEFKLKNNWTDMVDNFDQLNIKENLLRGIYSYGFEKPSNIQQKAIIPLIQGQDLVAQAQSGSGKTAVYLIGTLQIIDHTSPKTQALILVPSIELVKQISTIIKRLGEFLKVTVHSCIDGTNMEQDKNTLQKQGIQIVVGTPKKVQDVISKGYLKTNNLKLMVIDEADYILSKDYIDDMCNIFQYLPGNIQISLFSITFPSHVLDIIQKIMNDHTIIIVENNELMINNVKQQYIQINKNEWKFQILQEIYNNINIVQAIIFANNQQNVEQLTLQLKENQISVAPLHEQLSLEDRDKVIKNFKSGDTRILVATDKLVRGMDFQNASLIINYDLPTINFQDSYIHRVGRTSRFGRSGQVINFALPSDIQFLKEIEQQFKIKINEISKNFIDNDIMEYGY